MHMKQTLKEFLADLRESVFTSDDEKRDMTIVEFFFDNSGEQAIMDHVVTKILPWSKEIAERNIDFFSKQKDSIFKGLPQQRVDYFEKLLRTPESQGGMSLDNRDVIWLYFDTIISIAQDYKKNK